MARYWLLKKHPVICIEINKMQPCPVCTVKYVNTFVAVVFCLPHRYKKLNTTFIAAVHWSDRGKKKTEVQNAVCHSKCLLASVSFPGHRFNSNGLYWHEETNIYILLAYRTSHG